LSALVVLSLSLSNDPEADKDDARAEAGALRLWNDP
jgi:hypothetical protein